MPNIGITTAKRMFAYFSRHLRLDKILKKKSEWQRTRGTSIKLLPEPKVFAMAYAMSQEQNQKKAKKKTPDAINKY